MEVIRGLAAAREKFALADKTMVTIGVFDGVHLGHRRVIETTCRYAHDLRLVSVVLTFSYHPEQVLDSENAPPLITSPEHKIRLIEQLGTDFCVLPDFEKELSGLSAEMFVKDVLAGVLKTQGLCVGYDFVFGKDRHGDIKLLQKLGRKLDIKIIIEGPVKIKDEIVSSSLIRKLIMNGELESAAQFMGRPVSVLGTVIEGHKRGRKLAYPTANINPHHEAIPPMGVYCVRVRHKDKMYGGILNIGTSPTFDVNENRIEVHLLDFDNDVYGEDLEIVFVSKIRSEIKFGSGEGLTKQLQADEAAARKILVGNFL